MAEVVVAPTAVAELESLIVSLSLPTDTKQRFARAVWALREFPELGPSLQGRWQGYRFLLGPWRWMLIVYRYYEIDDRVAIVTVQDSRSHHSPTVER